jgi:hypothetical protein
MTPDEPLTLSAQVVMRSASGRSARSGEPITAANLRDYQPSPQAAAAAMEAFASLGFQVGPLVGISFSITAPRKSFERTFGARFTRDADGAVTLEAPDPSRAYELPLDRLPADLAAQIEAVTVSPPVDFGPTRTGPW